MLLHRERLRISPPAPLNLEWPVKREYWGINRMWEQGWVPRRVTVGWGREELRAGGCRKEEGQAIAAKRGLAIPNEGEQSWEASSMTQSRWGTGHRLISTQDLLSDNFS